MGENVIPRRPISQRILQVGLMGAVLLWGRQPVLAEDVVMNLQDLGKGTYRLEGQFHIAGAPYDVWKVLTDYEHISSFVSSLRKSSVKESTTDRIMLEQEALGKEFVFSKRIRVMLQVSEIPYKRIDFEDVLHKDFSFYEGAWEIKSSGTGVDVHYKLSCRRLFVVPNVIAKDALKKSATELLAEVRAEVLRRKEGSPTP